MYEKLGLTDVAASLDTPPELDQMAGALAWLLSIHPAARHGRLLLAGILGIRGLRKLLSAEGKTPNPGATPAALLDQFIATLGEVTL